MPDNPEDLSGVLKRINQLGAATEQVFSRVYGGLGKRSRTEAVQNRREELHIQIDQARRITEQNKQLQTSLALRIGEVERLESILSTLGEGIIMQDNEGQIVYINRAARELLGSQKNFWDTQLGILFNQYKDVTQTNSELVPLGDPESIQVNDRILGAQLAAVANNNGERLGTMIVLRDVTRDALADRLKDQFVTAISHELKTPMTVIKGMSEVLMGQPADQPPNHRLLQTLSRNVDILDRMVVELLDVSEMGADTFDIRQDDLALEPLLWGVINGMNPEVKKGRLQVSFMSRNISELKINGDEQRLRWALGHLLQNSLHYTLPGGHVMVKSGINHKNPEQIFIDFIDNGVGISDKDLPHIFERFYRGDPRDPDGRLVDPRGLGQGLFIAKTVAETHGGFITVDSQSSQGSVFTLTLPAIPN